MADTSELLPGDVFGIIDRLRSYAAHKGNRKNAPVSSKLMAEAADVIERLAAKSRLQAEAPEDAEVDEEHPLVEHVARAIAVNGVGRPWDDFAAVNAHDMDQGDLKQYALAAIRATPHTSQAEAQAPTTAVQTMSKPIADIRSNMEREAQDRTNTAAAETAISRMVLVRDLTAILEDFERVTPQAESTSENRAAFIAARLTAPTAASVLTEDEPFLREWRAHISALRGDAQRPLSSTMNAVARMLAIIDRPTVGAPAPAATIPTRKKIEVAATRVWEIAKHQAPIEPGTDHERIVRVIEGLFAKGDTP